MDIESIPARRTELGSLKILRGLPRRQRRMVGAWCFLDRYGPIRFSEEKPMDVAPHPHMGLQTVSWLVAGEIVHKDSLGCEAVMHEGQLNLMTAGSGIAHSEETPKRNSGELEGVQLWIALPDSQRQTEPLFDHYASLPVFNIASTAVTLIIGQILNHSSPARAYSPIVGAEIAFPQNEVIGLPLERNFEHAILMLGGEGTLDGKSIGCDILYYVAPGRPELQIGGGRNCRMLLIGGEPFQEPVLMWWNFAARSHEEIASAREDWARHQRFGEVKNYLGPRFQAPEFAPGAAANPAS